nr:hypothetical protein CFP56_28057 [Quercus suber]
MHMKAQNHLKSPYARGQLLLRPPQGGQGPQGENKRLNLDPLLNQRVPSQPKGPQASPYLTKEDIAAILLEARKAESSAYIDTRPCPEEMARKSYPSNYTSLIFPKSDHHTMDCYALRNIFHEKLAKGDLVIKNGKHADQRMHRLGVAMTFFIKTLWKERLRI